MKFKAHNYQQVCIDYVEEHDICALFLDCGLGKTIITLTAIISLLLKGEIKKVLIIAPKRVALNTWPSEIMKWVHTRQLRYSVVVGTQKQRLEALKADADIYIINKETVQWLVEESGVDFDFEMVVIDELSCMKNPRSHIYRSLMKVRPKVKRMLGLTGTPASNGLMDLYGEITILDNGERFGKFITRFRNDYFLPDKYNGNIVYSYKPLPNAEEAILDKISDMCISLKIMDVLDMPELIINDYECKMSKKEMQIYREFKKEYIVDLDGCEIDANSAAALSLKLQQLSSGAIYVQEQCELPSGDISNKTMTKEIHNAKLDALEDLIEAMCGKPVLVVYWFKHELTRITKLLDKLGLTYSKIDDIQSINDWCDKKLQVGLLHPASAGHGLNLQSGGNTMIWFTPIWSLELYQQTLCRLYRQGVGDTVVIWHIKCVGTIDSRILKALADKDETQNSLIEAVKAEVLDYD